MEGAWARDKDEEELRHARIQIFGSSAALSSGARRYEERQRVRSSELANMSELRTGREPSSVHHTAERGIEYLPFLIVIGTRLEKRAMTMTRAEGR